MTVPATNFDAFCRSEQAMLLRYFRKHVGRDAAPDLVQDAFMRILRSGAFDRIDYPRPYLLRTARNLVFERARRMAREGVILYPFDETCDAAQPPEQIRRMDELDIRRTFRPTLLAMRPRTRRIFLMSRLRQQTYCEIADELGISIKSVEKHITRALEQCRKAYARQGARPFGSR